MTDVAVTSPNPWRQGSVLPSGLAVSLKIIAAGDIDRRCVVVVSHDCDVANLNLELEPDVEVIEGSLDPTPSGNLTGAKNPRRLQLSWAYEGAPRLIELSALQKQRVPKQELQHTPPDSRYSLGQDGLYVLRYWLAARYNRSALPDAFNNRLKQTKVGEDLLKALAPCGFITGVYVLLDSQEERAADDPTPYQIEMLIAYNLGTNPRSSQARTQIDDVVHRIESDFTRRCYDRTRDLHQWLQLMLCSAVSEDDLRVSDVKRLQQLYLDYLSLRTHPQGVTAWGVKH